MLPKPFPIQNFDLEKKIPRSGNYTLRSVDRKHSIHDYVPCELRLILLQNGAVVVVPLLQP